MKETISERLKRLRNQAGLSQQRVADALGVSRVAVTKWESGQTSDIRHDSLLGMAKLYQISLEELMTGESPAETRATFARNNSSNVTHVPTMSGRRVPLLSTVPAGNWRQIVDDYMMGGAPDYDYSTKDLGAHGFALTVTGDSMLPDFRDGDVIFINPELQPKPGCFVVARNHKLEATFKRYRPRGLNDKGEDYFELVPLNEDYPTLRSDQMAIEIIGVVVEHRRITI